MKYLATLIILLFIISSNEILQAQWVQTNGPNGGNVSCLAVSGTNIFVGTYGGGVSLSTNNGSSWIILNDGLRNTAFVSSLVVSGNNMFAGTWVDGVYRSTNNGTNWIQIGLNGITVGALVITGNNIFAGTDSGVFRSTNNGTNWAQVNNGLPTYTVVNTIIVADTNIFAGTNSGMFLSTNNGTHWTQVNNGLTNFTVWSLIVEGNYIFTGTGGGVFLSTNNGTNWTQVALGTKDVRSLSINGTKIFAGTYYEGVFLSTNNGTNWTQVNNGLLTNTTVNAITTSGSNIFVGTYNGVYLSTNTDTTWTLVGLPITDVNSLIVSGTNIFAGTGGSGVFISTDNGKFWKPIYNGLGYANVNSLAVSGTNIFAGTSSGVFLSTNNGSNWTQVGLTNTFIWSLAFTNSDLYAGTMGAGVWKRPLSEFSTDISKEVNELPQDFALSQNYPNPFNPRTVISYSLPAASNIKLIVYSTLGQKIKTLESGYKPAGNYSINFNASDLPNGIYFYKLEAGQFSQIKKMILIK